MTLSRIHLLAILLIAAVAFPPDGCSEVYSELLCRQSLGPRESGSVGSARKYAPDREYDVLHLALDVTPDFVKRRISGIATLELTPVAFPLKEIRLDAVDLAVTSVDAGTPILGYHSTTNELIITLAEPLPVDKRLVLKVIYSAEPKKGLYFRTAAMGYTEGEDHLYTQGEQAEARHWYPSKDFPNEKFTTEITCHVPDGMEVISNGKLLSKAESGGLSVFHWSQDKPHANYLVSLVAGYFKKAEDKVRDIPLVFWVPPSEADQAAGSLKHTAECMTFFERETGTPYPWDKYHQTVVRDFQFGGMENTSVTTLTDGTLFTPASENIHSSVGLMAHELAHQWFGDYVTCRDWAHLWLNEGFATYYGNLYEGELEGQDAFRYNMRAMAQGFLGRSAAEDTLGVSQREKDQFEDILGTLIYPKGAWVLHMLRHELGDEVFRRCIKTYLDRHRFGTVVTHDLVEVIEEISGRSFERFFDQWIYHAHWPELKVEYSWDERARLARVSVQQLQPVNERILQFRFPLDIAFKAKGERVVKTIRMENMREDFYLPLPFTPEIVRVDPSCALLAKIQFETPRAMTLAMLGDMSDMLGRLQAVDALGKETGADAVERLAFTAKGDPFFGVRVHAIQGLTAIHSEEALLALVSCTNQPDARVRLEVASALARFFHPQALAALKGMIGREKNPEIIRAAAEGLGSYPPSETRALIGQILGTPSYQQIVAAGAIRAIRGQGDPSWVPAVIELLERNQKSFPRARYAQALEAIGWIGHWEHRDVARDFLARHLTHPRDALRLGAIKALGTLQDEHALPMLESFLSSSKSVPERAAAQEAVNSIRGARRIPEEWQALRGEVTTLQKENRELRDKVDGLSKRLDAAFPAAPTGRNKQKK